VDAKETKTLELTLPEPESAERPITVPIPARLPSPPPPPPRNRFSPGFWFSTGMTGVSLALVTAFGTMTLNKKEDYRASGWTDADAKERGERYKTITNAMVGLAGASAAAALLVAIADTNGHSKAGKDRAVDVSPSGSGSSGVGFEISF
jgi:hypothetical protein